jgi:MoxR-like ATPase
MGFIKSVKPWIDYPKSIAEEDAVLWRRKTIKQLDE